jgi:predicted metal-binding protein
MGTAKRHFFVCTNRRPADSAKPSCGQLGGDEILFALREERERRGLSADVYITATGCLGPCHERGTTIVVYPEAVWYCGVTMDDVAYNG